MLDVTSTHLTLGVRTCIGPLNYGRHKVRNVTRPVRGGFAQPVLSEIMGVCKTIERKMEDSGDLDLR